MGGVMRSKDYEALRQRAMTAKPVKNSTQPVRAKSPVAQAADWTQRLFRDALEERSTVPASHILLGFVR